MNNEVNYTNGNLVRKINKKWRLKNGRVYGTMDWRISICKQ